MVFVIFVCDWLIAARLMARLASGTAAGRAIGQRTIDIGLRITIGHGRGRLPAQVASCAQGIWVNFYY